RRAGLARGVRAGDGVQPGDRGAAARAGAGAVGGDREGGRRRHVTERVVERVTTFGRVRLRATRADRGRGGREHQVIDRGGGHGHTRGSGDRAGGGVGGGDALRARRFQRDREGVHPGVGGGEGVVGRERRLGVAGGPVDRAGVAGGGVVAGVLSGERHREAGACGGRGRRGHSEVRGRGRAHGE